MGVYVAQVQRVPFVDQRPWHTRSAYVGDLERHERRADVWAVDDTGFHGVAGPLDLLHDRAPNAVRDHGRGVADTVPVGEGAMLSRGHCHAAASLRRHG